MFDKDVSLAISSERRLLGGTCGLRRGPHNRCGLYSRVFQATPRGGVVLVVVLSLITDSVVQFFTQASISLSIPGHHTYPLASVFILTIPRWASCNISTAFDWHDYPAPPQYTTPSVLSSYHLRKNGLRSESSSGSLSGHPVWTSRLTFESIVSRSVQFLI